MTPAHASIESGFRETVSSQVHIAPEGVDRYRVFTPFHFDDGDGLCVVLKREDSGWVLSDEGNTLMHLTYRMDADDLRRGTRAELIDKALSMFHVEDRDGELVIDIPGEQYGDALYSFVQALLKISDVAYLSRERVTSAFLEDFHGLLAESIPPDRRILDWTDPDRDPDGHYVVDCRVNGMAQPLFIYGLRNDSRTRDATIALMQFEKWDVSFRSVAIFEDQERINRKVLARFTNVCERQFSGIPGNRERIASYLTGALKA